MKDNDFDFDFGPNADDLVLTENGYWLCDECRSLPLNSWDRIKHRILAHRDASYLRRIYCIMLGKGLQFDSKIVALAKSDPDWDLIRGMALAWGMTVGL